MIDEFFADPPPVAVNTHEADTQASHYHLSPSLITT